MLDAMGEEATFSMTRRGDDDVVLDLAGELDVVGAPALGAEIERIIADRPRRLLVDLADLDFLDSAGLATLVHGLNQADAAGVEFALASPNRRCYELLEVTRLDDVFKIID
jgi:anti-sigma B factor antagonist